MPPEIAEWCGTLAVAQAAYHGQGLLSAAVDWGYTATNGLLPDAAAASAPKWVISPNLKFPLVRLKFHNYKAITFDRTYGSVQR